jgi:hypothetical protein
MKTQKRDRITKTHTRGVSASTAARVSLPDEDEGDELRPVDVEDPTPFEEPKLATLVSKRLYQKSPKEAALDKMLLKRAGKGLLGRVVQAMIDDTLIASMQNYANIVSIQRLGYNDHGPVHARIVALNCMRIFEILREAGIKPSIVAEEVGDPEDSMVAIFIAAFLHDIGMSVAREDHEQQSIILCDNMILKHLGNAYQDEGKVYMLRSLIAECILGHMGHYRVHSVEAGIVMVGDGTDCTKGRSMIPQQIARNPMIGDIHRFSASAIDSVHIRPGRNKPVRIDVMMNATSGMFQVEEVLMGKAKMSPIMNHLEIAAHLDGQERLYLR